MTPGGVIHGSKACCFEFHPAGRVHRSSGLPVRQALVGWFADADPQADGRRKLAGRRIANADSQADRRNRAGGLRTFYPLIIMAHGANNVRGILPLSYISLIAVRYP